VKSREAYIVFFYVLRKLVIIAIIVVVTGIVFGIINPTRNTFYGISDDIAEAKSRGVLEKEYKALNDTVHLGPYGSIVIEEAWAECYWRNGLFVWTTDRSVGRKLYNVCIRLKGTNESLSYFSDSSDSLQIGLYPTIYCKRKRMYTSIRQQRPIPDTVRIPVVSIDVSRHDVGRVLDTLDIITLVPARKRTVENN
jgi:hypothetical protein